MFLDETVWFVHAVVYRSTVAPLNRISLLALTTVTGV